MTYNFNNDLYVIAGVRWSEDEQNDIIRNDGLFNGGSATFVSLSSKDEDISPRFVFGYKTSENMNIYASATHGFRAGGGQSIPPSPVCDADLLTLQYSAK